MELINIDNKFKELESHIASVEDRSSDDPKIERLLIKLSNGWYVSIIRDAGNYTYSSHDTFEVAVKNPEMELDYSLTDGDVLCYQSPEEIVELALNIIKENPKEI